MLSKRNTQIHAHLHMQSENLCKGADEPRGVRCRQLPIFYFLCMHGIYDNNSSKIKNKNKRKNKKCVGQIHKLNKNLRFMCHIYDT